MRIERIDVEPIPIVIGIVLTLASRQRRVPETKRGKLCRPTQHLLDNLGTIDDVAVVLRIAVHAQPIR